MLARKQLHANVSSFLTGANVIKCFTLKYDLMFLQIFAILCLFSC